MSERACTATVRPIPVSSRPSNLETWVPLAANDAAVVAVEEEDELYAGLSGSADDLFLVHDPVLLGPISS